MILLGVITIRDYIKIITQAKDYVFFGFDKEFDLVFTGGAFTSCIREFREMQIRSLLSTAEYK